MVNGEIDDMRKPTSPKKNEARPKMQIPRRVTTLTISEMTVLIKALEEARPARPDMPPIIALRNMCAESSKSMVDAKPGKPASFTHR